ncbi:hypothetical protein EPA93_31530 [Ktedonosporobacter rubrisoli]|uniref:Uncharacterized protein n=1 Tax=Ktedonosporobacter rubrisoli TaxID=2509675 RepID=A0A4P6JX06_KTERU|nr:hypothetical protein [Ktedonosporobacter rubrisoli]QBD80267.1 hypothetical protein EPA93_31530 [Ktedonosporobacter rubrisoli]
MAMQQLHILPLLDIQSVEFANHYEQGVWSAMYGDQQGEHPIPISYLVQVLRDYEKHGYFTAPDCATHLQRIGFYLGVYHGGVLAPQSGLLRSGISTLARLDHPEACTGYRIGRWGYFHNQLEDEDRRWNEPDIPETLQELVADQPCGPEDNEAVLYYCAGSLLGALSGELFPETPEERRSWQVEYNYSLGAEPTRISHYITIQPQAWQNVCLVPDPQS